MKNSIPQNYAIFDVGRIIAAILVIAIHCMPSYNPKNAYVFVLGNIIARLAVPYFFVVAGYFLAFKDVNDTVVIKSYVKRLIKLYIIWSLIYLPANIYIWIENENTLLGVLDYIKDFIFIGSFIQFWYFPAIIFSVIAVHFLLKKFKDTTIILISTIIYIIGLFGDTYYGVISATSPLKKVYDIYLSFFETTRNGLFFGLLFVAIGVYIKKNNKKMSMKKSTLGLVFSLVGLFMEAYFISYLGVALDYNIYLFAVPTIFFLVLWLQDITLPNRNIYLRIRKMSVLIFGVHIIINGVVIFLAYSFNLSMLVDNYGNTLLSITMLSFIFSEIVLRISENNPNSWLRRIY